MARWRLTQPHYLNVPGTEWEYKETDRSTGRQARKVFHVPLLLDPNNPADYLPGSPDLTVCYEGKGTRFDYVFVGPPTPDMEPLDEEAEAISKAESKNWIHPIESLPGDYSQSLIASFERQMTEIIKAQGKPLANQTVDRSEIDELKQQMAQLIEMNAQLQAQLAQKLDSEPGLAKARRA